MREMYDIKGKWWILGKYVDRGSVRHAFDIKEVNGQLLV